MEVPPWIKWYKLFWIAFLCYLLSSSTIRLRPLGLFHPPGNHLPILSLVFLYFFSLQVCNLIFFWVVCCHPFFVYVRSNVFYIALICLKIKNAQLFSHLATYFFFKSVYPAVGLKNLISAASTVLLSDRFRDQFSLPYITSGTDIKFNLSW